MALLTESHVACVMDSYEVQVHCVDPVGNVVGTFGREGEGPGDFKSSVVSLVGGKNGTLGVVDIGLARFTVFSPDGSLMSTIPLPRTTITFDATGVFGDTLTALGLITFDPLKLVAGAGPGGLYSVFDVDVSTGLLLREQEVPPVDVSIECGTVYSGFPNRLGGWVYIACEGHLVLVNENGDVTVIQAPTYSAELPSDAEVSRWIEGRRRPEATDGIPLSDERIERFRNRTKNYHLTLGTERFDEWGNIWIATQRDRHDFSYFDVYSAAELEYLGSVEIEGRLIGFDLVGSTLVTLVERWGAASGEDAVIPSQQLDWYQIAEL